MTIKRTTAVLAVAGFAALAVTGSRADLPTRRGVLGQSGASHRLRGQVPTGAYAHQHQEEP